MCCILIGLNRYFHPHTSESRTALGRVYLICQSKFPLPIKILGTEPEVSYASQGWFFVFLDGNVFCSSKVTRECNFVSERLDICPLFHFVCQHSNYFCVLQMGFFRRHYREIIEAEKNRKDSDESWDWVQKSQWELGLGSENPISCYLHPGSLLRPRPSSLPYVEEKNILQIFRRFDTFGLSLMVI